MLDEITIVESQIERAKGILAYYGVESQRLKAIEEAGEWIRSLARISQLKSMKADMNADDYVKASSECDSNFLEETADLVIMIAQMVVGNGFLIEEILDEISKKLERTERRIGRRN